MKARQRIASTIAAGTSAFAAYLLQQDRFILAWVTIVIGFVFAAIVAPDEPIEE